MVDMARQLKSYRIHEERLLELEAIVEYYKATLNLPITISPATALEFLIAEKYQEIQKTK